MFQTPPPAAASAPPAINAPASDHKGLNIVALICHGPPDALARLSADAAAQGFAAKHAEGPSGDELMILFKSTNQRTAWPFVERVESGPYPDVTFEHAILPTQPNG
jgi:hypothetical protein